MNLWKRLTGGRKRRASASAGARRLSPKDPPKNVSSDQLDSDACAGPAVLGRRKGLLDVRHLRTLEGHTSVATSVALSADGSVAVSGSSDQTLRVWEVTSARCLQLLTPGRSEVVAVKLSSDGRFALSANWDGALCLWDLGTGRRSRTLRIDTDKSPFESVEMAPDGHLVVWGNEFGRVWVWEPETGRRRALSAHRAVVQSVALSADGRFALSGSEQFWFEGENVLRFWDLASGRWLREMVGHTRGISAAALTADGRFAVSGSRDRTLRLWELPTGSCVCVLKGHKGTVTSVALAADGRLAVSGSEDGTLCLWELPTGSCVCVLKDHKGTVTSVALAADGRLALSGSADHTLRLWRLDWDYEFPDPADWDDGARPYLETFLTLHTPFASSMPEEPGPSAEFYEGGLLSPSPSGSPLAFSRRGKPSWTEADFQRLICQLQYAGYGSLQPEGVRAELERMARGWTGPPPSPLGAGGSATE